MEPAKLISSATELALDLLEKRGEVVPFCKAVAEDGSSIIYTPETSDSEDIAFRKAEEFQRKMVLQDVSHRKLVGLAFCKEVTLTMSEPNQIVSAIRVEIHHVDSKPLVYWFPYEMKNGKATVLQYYTRDVEAVPLWTRTENPKEDLPNQQPPPQTPTNGTAAAGAPVAPPSGTVGI
jgi:hypothetical protein